MGNAPRLDTSVTTLGPCKVDNPLPYCHHIDDDSKMPLFLSSEILDGATSSTVCEFEEAGPGRKSISTHPRPNAPS